jgi:hypothetical protein
LQANEDRVDEILEDYSFTQKSISRELGKDGVLRETESETFQLSFYKGNRIRRLIEKNGKPLSEKEQADEDKNVQKRVAEIEKEIAKKEAKPFRNRKTERPKAKVSASRLPKFCGLRISSIRAANAFAGAMSWFSISSRIRILILRTRKVF